MLTAEHYLDSLLVSVRAIKNRYGKSKIRFCLFYISDKIIQIIEIYFHSEIRWLKFSLYKHPSNFADASKNPFHCKL